MEYIVLFIVVALVITGVLAKLWGNRTNLDLNVVINTLKKRVESEDLELKELLARCQSNPDLFNRLPCSDPIYIVPQVCRKQLLVYLDGEAAGFDKEEKLKAVINSRYGNNNYLNITPSDFESTLSLANIDLPKLCFEILYRENNLTAESEGSLIIKNLVDQFFEENEHLLNLKKSNESKAAFNESETDEEFFLMTGATIIKRSWEITGTTYPDCKFQEKEFLVTVSDQNCAIRFRKVTNFISAAVLDAMYSQWLALNRKEEPRFGESLKKLRIHTVLMIKNALLIKFNSSELQAETIFEERLMYDSVIFDENKTRTSSEKLLNIFLEDIYSYDAKNLSDDKIVSILDELNNFMEALKIRNWGITNDMSYRSGVPKKLPNKN